MPSMDPVTVSEDTAPYLTVQLNFISKVQPGYPLGARVTMKKVYGSRDYLLPLKELTARRGKTNGEYVK